MKVNRVCFVVDKSSSMSGLTNQVIKSLNDMIESHKVNTKQYKMLTFLSRVDFADNANVVFKEVQIKDVGPQTYHAYGNTAIFDALRVAISTVDDGSDDPDTAYFVSFLTDGAENASKMTNAAQAKKLIEEKEKDGRWTITFQVPYGQKEVFHRQFGIPLGNITEWEVGTVKGVEQYTNSNNIGFNNYYSARSVAPAGQNFSVKNFYTVDADLANVKAKDIKAKLDDYSDKLDVYTVDKECAIKDFIEAKTGKKYIIGSAYYQLSKSEVVQPSKDVFIMEKNKKSIWGGDYGRKLIGLPTDGVSEAKINPYNLAAYEVYISSTSSNRKLVRGTKVLHDKNMTQHKKPTWEDLSKI